MSFLNIDEAEKRNKLDQIYRQGPDVKAMQEIESPEPGALYTHDESDAIQQMARGAITGIRKLAVPVADYVAPPMAELAKPLDEMLGTDISGYIADEPRAVRERLRKDRADAMQNGFVANLFNGLFDVGTRGAVGFAAGGAPGAASVVGGSEYYNVQEELAEQGVDLTTSRQAAALQATLTAAGVVTPLSLGASGLTNVLVYGPGISAGMGFVNRGGMHVLLKEKGYAQMAEQYQWLDAKAIAADIVMGSFFGGIGAHSSGPKSNRQFLPSDVDAAMTAAREVHLEADIAPGLPTNEASRNAHVAAVYKATEDLMNDRPVNVEDLIREAQFIEKPEPAAVRGEIESALRDAGLDDLVEQIKREQTQKIVVSEIPRASTLSPEFRAVETRMIESIGKDIPAAMERYAKLKDSDGGRVLNTDIARNLSSDYAKDRESRSMLSSAVHEPASWIVKKMYEQKLRQRPAEGQDPEVLFTAGGTGAGKTTAVTRNQTAKRWHDRAQIVYDTNLNSVESATQKIDQALDAGKKVRIIYVHRDPVEAFHGSLGRAMNPEREGRTVPIESHAETHAGAPNTLREIANIYKDNPNVRLQVIENSEKGQRFIDVDSVPEVDYNQLVGKLQKVLEKEREAGRISEAVYRGTAGRLAAGEGVRVSAEPAGRGSEQADAKAGQEKPGGVHEDLRPGSDAESPGSVELKAADEAVSLKPDLTIIDDAGNEVPASEMLARADADIRKAENDANGFSAAVECFLRYGT